MKSTFLFYFKALTVAFLLNLSIAKGQLTGGEFTCTHVNEETNDLTGPSKNGYGHTPKGNLHIIMVYTTFLEDDNNPSLDDLSPYWPKNGVPLYAQEDANGNSGVLDRLFNAPSTYPNLTKWFRDMSNYLPPNGQDPGSGFVLTGKVFHVQISKSYPTGAPLMRIHDLFNERTIEALTLAYPNEDWTNFDTRTNNPRFVVDNSNSGPDGNIDYFTVNYRMTKDQLRALDLTQTNAGWADLNLFNGFILDDNPNDFIVSQGHTLLYYMDLTNYITYFNHEFSHNLMQSLHYASANSSVGGHYYCSNGWGLMEGINAMFQTVNGWERRRMGWVEPQTITQSGTYYLKDFVTENDCIRIPIPGSELVSGNGGFPEYLYLESHMLINHFDKKPNFNDELPTAFGIYAYMVRRDNFNYTILGNVNEHVLANNFRMLSKAGNWDHGFTNSNGKLLYSRMFPNDIGGQNFLQALRLDLNNDGKILYEGFEGSSNNEMAWVNNFNGIEKPYYTGSDMDAFRVGDEISLSGNVAALNYNLFNGYKSMNGGCAFYRGMHLNGLKIKIVDYDATTKTYEIEVDFEYYKLEKNARWAAPNIYLKNLTQNSEPDLILENGNELIIDRSYTPNSDVFETTIPTIRANPGETTLRKVKNYAFNTRFRMETGSYAIMKPLSKIKLLDESNFILRENATLEIQSGAVLSVNSGSKLELLNSSKIIVKDGGRIVIDYQSSLEYRGKCNIILEGDNSIIEFKEGSKLAIFSTLQNPSTFEFSGNGYLIFHNSTAAPTIIEANGTNCQFILKSSESKKVLELFGNAPLVLPSQLSKFEIVNSTVVMNENTSINIHCAVNLNIVSFTSNPQHVLLKHNGIRLFGQNNVSISALKITNATNGLTALNNVGNNPIKITSIRTDNCDYGFYCIGKGVTIYAGEFYGSSKAGIYLEGQDLPNNLYSITAKGNLVGAQIIGSKGILTNFFLPKIEYNGTGIVAVNAHISAKCGVIRNSGGKNVYLGYNATMDLDPNHILGAGNIDFSSSGLIQTPPILIKLEYSGLGPFLNNSKSNFISSGYKIKGELNDIYNTTFNESAIYPNILPVNQNYWMDFPTFGIPFNGSHTDVNYREYEFGQNSHYNTKTIVYRDYAPLTTASDYSLCNPFFGNQFSSIFVGLPEKQTLDETNFHVTFKNGIDYLYGDNPNYQLALNQFIKLLNSNYSQEEFGIWSNFALYNFNKITETVSNLMNDSLYASNEQLKNSNLLTLTNLYNLWDTRFNNFKSHQFDLRLSKLFLYKIMGNLNESYILLNTLQNDVKSEVDVKILNYYDCLIQRQIAFGNGSNQEYNNIIYTYCSDGFPAQEDEIPSIILGKGNVLENKNIEDDFFVFSLFPNPTYGQFTISFNTKSIGESYSLELLDLVGRVVYTYEGKCQNDNYVTTDLSGVMAGQYFVKVKVGSQVKMAKLLISK